MIYSIITIADYMAIKIGYRSCKLRQSDFGNLAIPSIPQKKIPEPIRIDPGILGLKIKIFLSISECYQKTI